MNMNKRSHMAAVLLAFAIIPYTLSACNSQTETEKTTETSPHPMTAEQTVPIEQPVFDTHPFSIYLADGTEIEITLPRDPELYAELHLCNLSDDQSPAHVLIHSTESGTGALIEEVRVFSDDDGTEYSVVPVNEILSRYVIIAAEETQWRMTVNGAEYLISKEQFADYPPEQIFAEPDFSQFHNFYVENGQLYCRISLLCAGNGTGFAAETLKIRYHISDNTVTAAEITFERPDTTDTDTP